ncbi:MAG: tetratricopeptide repeat protein [Candidatus Omnitrophica bacterium]|nr:tetratricopeptide repeat protein [Candidatus Omnitrophota bacterium]
MSAGAAQAAWLWDPETGKWTNTKDVARDTPQAQYDVAKQAFDAEDYKKALDEFDKLIRHYPNNRWAAEAQFYKGLIFEKTDDVAKAAEAFRTVVDRYPYSNRINDAIEKEYQIAEAMMEGKKTKVLGMAILPAEDEAADLYRHILRNAPYGPYGAAAQFRLGDAELKLGNFEEAERAYKAVIDEYPNTEWHEKAQYQIAKVSFKSAMTDEYNQDRTNEAISKYEGFKKSGALSAEEMETDKAIQQLKVKKAESIYSIAEFYFQRKKYASAKIYFEDVIRQFPDLEISNRARDLLKQTEAHLGNAQPKTEIPGEESQEKKKPFLGLF